MGGSGAAGSLLHYRTFGHGLSQELPEEVTVTSAADGDFSSGGTYTGGLVIDVSADITNDDYSVDFPGTNHQVQPGSYTGGKTINDGFFFDGPTNYYLQYASTDWQILEAVYAPDGTLIQLAANFEWLTADGQRAMQGEVRYHSDYPLRSNLVFASNGFAASQSDDNLTVSVARNGDASAATSVDYHTKDYGAHSGRDYSATQGTLTWAAGDGAPKTFTVPLLHRTAVGDRVFFVHLDGSTTGDLVTAAATITDDTRPPAASLPAPSGTVDATYPLFLTNSSVVTLSQVVPTGDGSVFIVGNFNSVNGQFVPGLVRLNPQGAVDPAFYAHLPSKFSASNLALQPDGKLIVGGLAGTMPTTNSLVRLNADGSPDASFQAASLHSGGIFHLTLQQDGRLVANGGFQEGNGLLRLNTDGSVDTSFVRPTTNVLSEVEFALLQPDGKLLVSNEYGKVTRLNSDASVDGSFQAAVDIATGQYASTVALQPDGKLLASTYYLNNTKLSRFNHDGTLDPGFSFDSTTINKGAMLNAMALQPDGKVLVGLKAGDSNATPANSLVRLNADGTLDPTFQAGPELPVSIGTLAFNPNGTLFVSGGYYSVSLGNVVHTIFARLAAYPGGVEPTVTMTDSGSTASRSTGEAVTVTLTRDGDLSGPLVVNYEVKGKAAAGTDYQLLSGHKKIKAGQSSATFKIRPLTSGLGRGSLNAKVLLPASGVYRVGTTSPLKIKIVDQAGQ